jgi:hypothetical protein
MIDARWQPISPNGMELLATLERPLRDFYTRIFEGTQISDLKTILKGHDQTRAQLP